MKMRLRNGYTSNGEISITMVFFLLSPPSSLSLCSTVEDEEQKEMGQCDNDDDVNAMGDPMS